MKNLFIAALAILSLTAQAGEGPNSYSSVSLGYTLVDIDAEGFIDEIELDGFIIAGSFEINENFFVSLSHIGLETDEDYYLTDYYSYYDQGKIELNQNALSVGYHAPMNETTDFVAIAGVYRSEVKWLGDTLDDTGKSLSVGVRSRIHDAFELSGGLLYSIIDGDNETTVIIGAKAFLADGFYVGLGFGTSSDSNQSTLSFGYDF